MMGDSVLLILKGSMVNLGKSRKPPSGMGKMSWACPYNKIECPMKKPAAARLQVFWNKRSRGRGPFDGLEQENK